MTGWSSAWLRVWPFAIELTNEEHAPEWPGDLGAVVHGADGEGWDTRSTPVDSLLAVFLQACLTAFSGSAGHFAPGSDLLRARDMLQECEGHALLVAQLRLVERLPVLLRMDASWAKESLVMPLRSPGAEGVALWRALVSHGTLPKSVLDLLGTEIAKQAANPSMGVDSRERLLDSLIDDSLEASRHQRCPSVTDAELQQALRAVDNPVRSHAAETVVRFLRPVDHARGGSPETAFESAIVPFMENVWPRDHPLVTADVSRAFARMPAKSGESFAQAVDLVHHYLTGFDCHWMGDFDLDVDAWGDAPGIRADRLRGEGSGSVAPAGRDGRNGIIRGGAVRPVRGVGVDSRPHPGNHGRAQVPTSRGACPRPAPPGPLTDLRQSCSKWRRVARCCSSVHQRPPRTRVHRADVQQGLRGCLDHRRSTLPIPRRVETGDQQCLHSSRLGGFVAPQLKTASPSRGEEQTVVDLAVRRLTTDVAVPRLDRSVLPQSPPLCEIRRLPDVDQAFF